MYSLTVVVAFLATSCDSSDESAVLEERLEKLEKQNSEAQERERTLEMELGEQRLLSERDGIERERKLADEVRYALEQEGKATEEEVKGLLEREESLTRRELVLEGRQNEHFERFYDIRSKGLDVSEADLALAGRFIGENFAMAGDADEVEVADFYQALAPYGSWYESNDYGCVWQPAAVRDSSWRPYSRGRWACCDRGWVWISDEPFGWATYHYGRWANLGGGRSWVWVPGTEWAPNWCTWRQGSSSVGWAPLPPATLNGRGLASDQFPGVDESSYTFVDVENFDRPISRVGLPRSENQARLKEARNVTRFDRSKGRVFAGGPGYLDLSERIGRRVPYYQIARRTADATSSRPVRPGARLSGDRLVVTAPKVNPQARLLSRPVRVRGAIEASRAPSRIRMQPRVEIVRNVQKAPPAFSGDDDLGPRIVEALMPELPEKSMEAGFPMTEMDAEKVIMPELREAALKPKVVEKAGEDGPEGDERVSRNEDDGPGEREPEPGQAPNESMEREAPTRQSSQPERQTRESAPAPARSRPQSPRSDREREETEEGKRSPRGR